MRVLTAVAVLFLMAALYCSGSQKEQGGDAGVTANGQPVHEIQCNMSTDKVPYDLSCFATSDGKLRISLIKK
jgi:hypothetical protein